VQGDAARLRQLGGVTQQAEAGDVGRRARTDPLGDFRRVAVKTHHPRRRFHEIIWPGLVGLGGSGDAAGAQRLGQDQPVAGARAAFSQQPVGGSQPHHRQANLRLFVLDRMPASDDRARLAHLLGQADHDLCDHLRGQGGRQRGDVQRQQRTPAHRIDIAQGVGGGNRAVLVRVVHNRCEEVGGDDQRARLVEPVHGSIVRRAQTYQQVGVIHRAEEVLQGAQHVRQGLRGQFGRSASARRERCQANDVLTSHGGRFVSWAESVRAEYSANQGACKDSRHGVRAKPVRQQGRAP